MSWLESELREQPSALATLLDRESDRAREVAQAFRRDDIRYILIASRGSSSNAARYAQYLLGRANRVPVMFATPSLYTIYEQPPRLEGAIVIGISQSGASPDIISVLAEARRQGRPTVALTNDAASPLAQQADAVLPLDAGQERAVAATKTYLNSVGAVALLFAAISEDEQALDELKRMPEVLERQIALSLEIAAKSSATAPTELRYVFVAATARSWPASRGRTASASCASGEEASFVSATVGLPWRRASASTEMMSGDAPDCEIPITIAPSSRGGCS